MADGEAASSSGEQNPAYFAGESSSNPPEEQETKEEIYEPDAKRKKVDKAPDAVAEKLEHRLGGILCCAVCLDLPRAAVYQCTNGHLMCAGCFTHLLADARLRDEVSTCPNCRVEIGRSSASRNLAVEKAVSELPAECQFCNREFPRNSLDRHQQFLCEERHSTWALGPWHTAGYRITSCRFARIGCPWRGPWHEASSHEAACAHPTRTGLEVMEALQAASVVEEREKRLYDNIFELLSYEKITFNDLQMKPYRSDELVHKLFYETSRFSAFNNQWVVKARVTGSQRDPTQSSHREISYQLILKTKTAVPMSVHHLVVHGPFGDARVLHRINRFDFSDQDSECPEVLLPLADEAECNRLLASKAINFRLIMFLVSK